MPEPLRPPALRPGDRVAVAAPSSPVFRHRLEAGLEVLRSWDYEPVLLPHLHDARGHLAGSDEDRADDLNRAFRDRSIRAVFVGRGGYGLTRIVDRLDWGALAADPKVVVGFSDTSVLLTAAWRRIGLVGVHGQFVGRLHLQTGPVLDRLRRLVCDAEPGGEVTQPDEGPAVETIVGGVAEGPLLGGNLATLQTLIGTRDQPDFRGAVLFLEEVNEPPYKLDRMLTHLRRVGVLDGVAGVVVGELVGCDPSGQWPSHTVVEVLETCLADLGVPLIHGLSIGHVDHQVALPHGARARLDADAGTLELLESPVTR